MALKIMVVIRGVAEFAVPSLTLRSLLMALKLLARSAFDCLVVGDSDHDVEAAQVETSKRSL